MFLAGNVAQEKQSDVWFIDWGCNNNITQKIETLSILDESMKVEVTLETNSKVFFIRERSVNILTKQADKKYIFYIYSVPGLKHNLMRIGNFMQNAYNIFFKNDKWTILDKPPTRQFIAKF